MSAPRPGITRLGGPVMRAGQRQPITPVVLANGPLAFVSGQVPMIDGRPAADDIAGQTHATLDMIEALLAHAGARLSDVVKVNVWLTRAEDYPGFNAAYAERMGEAPPARSTVISGLIAPVLVEIEAVAVVPGTA
ncbi:RidA family protein [Achromobacter sp. GG226]|uniref:RidA family protein n=1 Tax=Verticiella alkaliphila TaxID=2779529 RepID=UPI00209BAE64|nr:RidA family protein [Verticiella sp. GG226]MBU4609549.1 RidA family protein [Verticiella sp. GG226]